MGSNGGEHINISGCVVDECSETTVEIKIKTLDSETFTLRVDKCVPVPELKEQIASVTGVLSDQQRLICCGKVLKDDQLLSAYHVEDGHTLHLVVRQPVVPSAELSDQPETDSPVSEGQNPGGRISPGMVVGTFNISEQGDGAFPDINRLARDVDLRCTFMDTHCVIQRKCGDAVLGVAKATGKLYVIEHDKADFAAMEHMPHLKGLCTSLMKKQIEACEICHKAKQSRNVFPLKLHRAENIFDLIHVDVWGPYHGYSISNTPYVLTVVDDHSRNTWTFLMTSKLQNLFVEHGIHHQHTCTYSPQQNGVVERKHRTLLQVARALMFQSCLPMQFWSYSILFATWIINRTPNDVLIVMVVVAR